MNMMLIFPLFFVTLSVVMFMLSLKSNKEEKLVQERIGNLAKSQTSNAPVLRQKALESSFTVRIIFPFAQGLTDKFERLIPMNSKSWVRSKLVQAGYHKPNYVEIFMGIQLLTTLFAFGFLFVITTLFGKIDGVVGFLLSGFFGLMGFGLPLVWLVQQAQKRQESIQKSIPDFLDLLVICVEAGLGLDTAITKIANLKTAKTSGYLKEELLRYTRDIALGRPRKDALLDVGQRTGVEDLNIILTALVQSYEMGSSVAHTLRVQADSLRLKRLQKAEEVANKIPVKMVLPIYIFLFPAIFVAIFGPIGMVVVKTIMDIFATAKDGGM